jgi:hypothetical protein
MMELLIIKSGKKYIRVKQDSYILCLLDKASVFSSDSLAMVKDHVKNAAESGLPDVSIYKLKLSEEPLKE